MLRKVCIINRGVRKYPVNGLEKLSDILSRCRQIKSRKVVIP